MRGRRASSIITNHLTVKNPAQAGRERMDS
jgi:hypothetical protein